MALGFLPEWLRHHREVGGEGYRSLIIGLSAWEFRSVPVVSAGVVSTALLGLAAVAAPVRIRAWLPIGAAGTLGLLVAGAWPIAQVGHVSRVWITPGWALLLAIVAASATTLLASLATRLDARRGLLAVALLVSLAVGGAWMRSARLAAAEADTQHWSDGTYSRGTGAGGSVLTLRDGTYTLGAWSGRIEAAGISVILTGDAGCPDARGFYHVRAGSGGGTLFELVVDTCGDGARAEALDGVWLREPDAD
jgi:hypothetical protein